MWRSRISCSFLSQLAAVYISSPTIFADWWACSPTMWGYNNTFFQDEQSWYNACPSFHQTKTVERVPEVSVVEGVRYQCYSLLAVQWSWVVQGESAGRVLLHTGKGNWKPNEHTRLYTLYCSLCFVFTHFVNSKAWSNRYTWISPSRLFRVPLYTISRPSSVRRRF